MKTDYIRVLALALLAGLAACEQQNGDADNPADSAADTLAVNADTGAAQMPSDPVVTKLDDVNDSNISGEATATHARDEVTVSILLKDGAQASASYPAHIHRGTCDAGGPVAVDIGPVQNLQSQKTIALSQLPANEPVFIQVHNAQGQPVACGNVEGHEGRDGAARDTAHTTTH